MKGVDSYVRKRFLNQNSRKSNQKQKYKNKEEKQKKSDPFESRFQESIAIIMYR